MRKTSLKNRLKMYNDMIQQQNYLPDLTGQLGIPFKEDLNVLASALTAAEPESLPKPLMAASVPAAVRPDEGGEGAKRSEATPTTDKAEQVAGDAAALAGCSGSAAVLAVADECPFTEALLDHIDRQMSVFADKCCSGSLDSFDSGDCTNYV